jgi:RNA polymerase primary sigma factor
MDESVRIYLKEINKVPDLTKDEELQIINLVLKDDRSAMDKLAEANMKKVALMALDYWEESGQKLDLFDLIHAGNIGLLSAVQSYTPGDYRFWEYATWWVRKEIEEFVKKS